MDLQTLMLSDASPQSPGKLAFPVQAHALGRDQGCFSAGIQPPSESATAAVYDQLRALIEPHAQDQHKWDVWAEEEDEAMIEEEVPVWHIFAHCRASLQ